MITKKCECEHEAHFEDVLTPNGNPAHKYGIPYSEHYIVSVKTPYGTFHICKDCAKDCYAQFPQVK